jgi:hypothetical protein
MSDTETTQQTMGVPPAPPYDDDGDEPEFRPRPRRRAHMLTYVLAGAMLVAAGFVVGVVVQKHQGSSNSSSNSGAAAAAARFRGAAGATGGGRGGAAGNFGGGAGGGTFGTVKLVDGKNVYVTDAQGNTVKVVTSDSSTITKTDPSKLAAIAPGDTVIVRGTASPDGSVVTATSLTDQGTTGLGGGGTTGG